MINIARLNTKLNAILGKNLDDLVANNVRLPVIGTNYTKATAQAWIDKRANLLSQAKNLTDVQITAAMTAIYNSLSANDKLLADAILDPKPHNLVSLNTAEDYEKLALIILYNYITTP